MEDENKARVIAAQNDKFRQNFSMPLFGIRGVPGEFFCTPGIAALPPETQMGLWAAVARFKDFSEDNDPHGEHDFGALTIQDVPEKVFWKIDYYADQLCNIGSEDPADPAQCYRVLTIMLASEY